MKNTLYGVPVGAAAVGRVTEEPDAPVLPVAEAVEPPLLALLLLPLALVPLLLLHAAAVTATTAAPAISARRFIEPTYLCQDAAMFSVVHPAAPRHHYGCSGRDA
jgi:hypothetical protein